MADLHCIKNTNVFSYQNKVTAKKGFITYDEFALVFAAYYKHIKRK